MCQRLHHINGWGRIGQDTKEEWPLVHRKSTDKSMELMPTITDAASLYDAITDTSLFGPTIVEQADRMKVRSTTKDACEDYAEFRLLKNSHVGEISPLRVKPG